MIFYRYYQNAPLATGVNVILRIFCTFFVYIGTTFILVGFDDWNRLLTILLGGVYLLIGVLFYLISNKIADRVALKAYAGIEERKAGLVPMDGKEVPDIREEPLGRAATVILVRDSSFVCSAIAIKYAFNSEEIFKLRNNRRIQFTTYRAVNTLESCLGNFNQKTDLSSVEFVVRAGETVTIHFKAQDFNRIERH